MKRAVGLGLVLVVAVGCSPASDDELFVSAASSLTEAFGEIENEFERLHPGVDVVLNLAGSSALREQILGGAPAEVFASANAANMEQVAEAGLVAGEGVVFAVNSLQIAVPSGNPADVVGLDDFARSELFLGLCAEAVPCGEFARLALDRAGVEASIDTNEPDVRSLLTKIESGDLDAGITYVTDVASTPGVEGVVLPTNENVSAEYEVAVIDGADELAVMFMDFILSSDGREILERNGFETP